MKKSTKWAMGIITFAILILVVIWGSMKMVQLEKEQEQAQKKLEEEQKEAEKLASEYMVVYIMYWTTIVIQLTVFTNVKQKMAISNHLSNY